MQESNSKQHIVILGPAYPLRGGGMATFNERLAREFQSQGNKVTIFTFSLQYPSILFPGTTQKSNEAPPEDLDIKVTVNSVNPLNWIINGLRLKKLRPDIIVVRYWIPFMGPCLGTILRLVRGNGHTKIICIADNVIPHEKRFADNSFTKYFIQPVHGFITMSAEVLGELRSFTKTKPAMLVKHPLYDGFGESVDKLTARKLLGVPAQDFVLLFFGFIRKYKGLDILLAAMPTVIKSVPHVKLIIAGEFYEDEQTYREQIKENGLESYILLNANFISDAEVRNYFCAADAVVQPYRNASQSGVTPLAYHYHLPIIVTNVGGLADMVPHGKAGLVTDPEPADIAQKIIEMYKSGTEKYATFIAEEKLQYSWQKLTEAIFSLATGVARTGIKK